MEIHILREFHWAWCVWAVMAALLIGAIAMRKRKLAFAALTSLISLLPVMLVFVASFFGDVTGTLSAGLARSTEPIIEERVLSFVAGNGGMFFRLMISQESARYVAIHYSPGWVKFDFEPGNQKDPRLTMGPGGSQRDVFNRFGFRIIAGSGYRYTYGEKKKTSVAMLGFPGCAPVVACCIFPSAWIVRRHRQRRRGPGFPVGAATIATAAEAPTEYGTDDAKT